MRLTLESLRVTLLLVSSDSSTAIVAIGHSAMSRCVRMDKVKSLVNLVVEWADFRVELHFS